MHHSVNVAQEFQPRLWFDVQIEWGHDAGLITWSDGGQGPSQTQLWWFVSMLVEFHMLIFNLTAEQMWLSFLLS